MNRKEIGDIKNEFWLKMNYHFEKVQNLTE